MPSSETSKAIGSSRRSNLFVVFFGSSSVGNIHETLRRCLSHEHNLIKEQKPLEVVRLSG